MTSMKQLLAVALAGAVLLSSVAAAGVGSSATANDSLDVAVESADNDGATVTVTQNGSAVESAFVTVGVTDENATYEGAGNYTTGENGTLSLPEPEENVTVEVTAEKNGAVGATTATLTADGTEEDEGDEQQSFGQMVSSFVDEMLNAGQNGGPLGQAISDFVTANNPGADKKSDHAGKPDDVGAQNNSSDEKGSQGPPENAGNDKDSGNGHGNGQSGNGQSGNGQSDNGQSNSGDETTTATTEADE